MIVASILLGLFVLPLPVLFVFKAVGYPFNGWPLWARRPTLVIWGLPTLLTAVVIACVQAASADALDFIRESYQDRRN